IMATLARDPARRPTAEQLAHLLAVTDAAEPPRADVSPAATPVATGPSARTKVLALALAAVAIVLVVLAITRKPTEAAQDVFDPRTQLAKPQANDQARDESARPAQRDEAARS